MPCKCTGPCTYEFADMQTVVTPLVCLRTHKYHGFNEGGCGLTTPCSAFSGFETGPCDVSWSCAFRNHEWCTVQCMPCTIFLDSQNQRLCLGACCTNYNWGSDVDLNFILPLCLFWKGGHACCFPFWVSTSYCNYIWCVPLCVLTREGKYVEHPLGCCYKPVDHPNVQDYPWFVFSKEETNVLLDLDDVESTHSGGWTCCQQWVCNALCCVSLDTGTCINPCDPKALASQPAHRKHWSELMGLSPWQSLLGEKVSGDEVYVHGRRYGGCFYGDLVVWNTSEMVNVVEYIHFLALSSTGHKLFANEMLGLDAVLPPLRQIMAEYAVDETT